MRITSMLAAGCLAVAMASPAVGQAQPIQLVNILELSGAGAAIGTNYKNGVELAVKEVNAAGGVLGRKLEVTTLDTQSNATIARQLVQRAVDMDAFAVIGPTFSGSMVVSMGETRRAQIPNFTGAAAASITNQGNEYVIRTNTTQSDSMPKLARYIKDTMKANTVDVIWINNDFGKGGRDEFVKAAQKLGIKIGADVSSDQNQLDFSGPVLKVKQSNSDVLFVYTNEEESARVLRELRKQGFAKPIIGETTLVNQKVIELAGDAANGVLGQVPLTADGPQPTVRAFDEKFTKEYKYKADHNAIQGYMVPYIIKVVSERIGKIDPKAFAAAMKDAVITTKDTPGILLDTRFDKKGDPDRVSYLIEVKNGKQTVTAILPAAGKF